MDAYVLGGGGQLGASEVGMLRALIERGLAPDLVVGTSVGAINGAAIASDPSPAMVQRLHDTWSDIERSDVFAGSIINRIATLARTKTHLHGNEALRAALTEALPIALIEDLPVRFQCVAASIERAAEHWFAAGDVVDAILASAAVPGILPPVEIGGEHYIDGGIVNSIPVDRAVELGATRIFVLHVGRLDRPLEPPRWPWEVGLVAFEIARRHRFHNDLERVRPHVTVHVLPSGLPQRPAATWSNLRYRNTRRIGRRADLAYDATKRYLEELP
jgi:NTE family protein